MKSVLLTLLLVLLLSIMAGVGVWAIDGYGALWTFNGSKPLQDASNRQWLIIAIIVIALLVNGFVLVRHVWLKKKSQTAGEKVAASQLYQRFDRHNAQQLMRLSALEPQAPAELHDRPWFLLLVEAGSRTATLKSLNLYEDTIEKEPVVDSVDDGGFSDLLQWHISAQAVYLELHDHFLQEENRALLKYFLHSLKRRRLKYAGDLANGLILGLDAGFLLQGHAELFRQNISRLTSQLLVLPVIKKSKLPLYLLLGSIPLPVYTDSELTRHCPGITLPERVKRSYSQAFKLEFERFLSVLNRKLLQGFEDGQTTNNTANYHRLRQLAGLERSISHAIADLELGTTIRLRGLYFTGISDQQMIDAISHTINAQYQFVETPVLQINPQPKTPKGIYSALILAEAGYGQAFWQTIRRYLRYLLPSYLATGFVITALVATWFILYQKNHWYLDDLMTSATKAGEVLAQKGYKASAHELLKPLNYLASVAEEQGVKHLAKEWLNSGYYLSDTVAKTAKIRYQDLLSRYFLPAVIKEQLTTVSLANSEQGRSALDQLRVIQLLATNNADLPQNQQEVLNAYRADIVTPWMQRYWETQYQHSARSQEISQQLGQHLEQALLGRPAELDVPAQTRIAQIQQRLGQLPLAERLYNQIKAQALALQPNKLDLRQVMGAGFGDVFVVRRADDLLIDRFYTYEGLTQQLLVHKDKLLQSLNLDAWVIGDKTSLNDYQANDLALIMQQVSDLYVNDYVKVWNAALDSLEIRQTPSFDTALSLFQASGNSDSPLPKLLLSLRENTVFQDSGSYPAKEKRENKNSTDTGGGAGSDDAIAASGALLSEALNQKVTERVSRRLQLAFQPWNALSEDDGNGGYVQVLSSKLAELAAYLEENQQKAASVPSSNLKELLAQSGSDDAKNPLKSTLRLLRQQNDRFSQQYQQRIQQTSLGFFQASIADLNQLWRDTVFQFYIERIHNRYPFAATTQEVSLDDFLAFYAKGGVLDSFHQNYLAGLLESDDPMIAKLANQLPRQLVDTTFKHAEFIREAFFKGGAEFNVSFSIEPLSLSNAYLASTLTLDGVAIPYRHGKPTPREMTWPAQAAGQSSIALSPSNRAMLPEVRNTAGQWSLFRLLQQSKTQALGERVRDISFAGRAGTASYRIQVIDGINPLTKDLFTGFQLPEKLVQDQGMARKQGAANLQTLLNAIDPQEVY